jgi:hypothetical protein
LFDLFALTLAFNDLEVPVSVRVFDADEHCLPLPSTDTTTERAFMNA